MLYGKETSIFTNQQIICYFL